MRPHPSDICVGRKHRLREKVELREKIGKGLGRKDAVMLPGWAVVTPARGLRVGVGESGDRDADAGTCIT